jgi:hypothetical protein
MDKLLELEKKLREAQAELNKIMSAGSTVNGSVASTGGPSIASQIGFGKADDDKKKKKHEDEKEDKELIAEAIDEHNEKKHGEDKDEDSAFKEKSLKKEEKGVHSSVGGRSSAGGISTAGLRARQGNGVAYLEGKHAEAGVGAPAGPSSKEFANESKRLHTSKLNELKSMPAPKLVKSELEKAGGPNKFGEKMTSIRENQVREERAPATEIHPETGEKKLITPEQQVKTQVDAKAAKKAKFEAEAKTRRAEYRKQGLVKFDKNGQWSMDKDC